MGEREPGLPSSPERPEPPGADPASPERAQRKSELARPPHPTAEVSAAKKAEQVKLQEAEQAEKRRDLIEARTRLVGLDLIAGYDKARTAKGGTEAELVATSPDAGSIDPETNGSSGIEPGNANADRPAIEVAAESPQEIVEQSGVVQTKDNVDPEATPESASEAEDRSGLATNPQGQKERRTRSEQRPTADQRDLELGLRTAEQVADELESTFRRLQRLSTLEGRQWRPSERVLGFAQEDLGRSMRSLVASLRELGEQRAGAEGAAAQPELSVASVQLESQIEEVKEKISRGLNRLERDADNSRVSVWFERGRLKQFLENSWNPSGERALDQVEAYARALYKLGNDVKEGRAKLEAQLQLTGRRRTGSVRRLDAARTDQDRGESAARPEQNQEVRDLSA